MIERQWKCKGIKNNNTLYRYYASTKYDFIHYKGVYQMAMYNGLKEVCFMIETNLYKTAHREAL